jgi:hypothetical protein
VRREASGRIGFPLVLLYLGEELCTSWFHADVSARPHYQAAPDGERRADGPVDSSYRVTGRSLPMAGRSVLVTRRPGAAARRPGAAALLALVLCVTGCTSTTAVEGGVAGRQTSSATSSPSAAASTAAATEHPDDPARTDPESAPPVDSAAVLAPGQEPAYGTRAIDLLAALPVKGRAAKTGYARDQFGPAWADVDHNGCDTRNDILQRDLNAVTFRSGTHNCIVLTGQLADPYTARAIAFSRGAETSEAVQIDHVVALSDAWQKGAQQLSPDQRLAFANDPLNLLAVDGPTNQQKSDGDAATWLPPNQAYRCDYVARQVSVKATYQLWVTSAEANAIAAVLAGCGDITAPTNRPAPAAAAAPPMSGQPTAVPGPVAPAAEAAAPAPAVAPEPAAVPAPAPAAPAPAAAPGGAPAGQPPAGASYANCAAVRAAGAAPIRRGDPGYAAKLDRDGDGVGCE